MGETIAERLEQCRKEKGWSKTELSRRTGLHIDHLWKILKGKRSKMEPDTIKKLARTFGVTTDYLLCMDIEETPAHT